MVGPGAVGGLLAARWAEAGFRVLLLDRAPAAEKRLASRGITVLSDGRRRSTRRNLRSARAAGAVPCAAAFLCVKAHDTAAALRAARVWIGPETAVVGLQNGLGHEILLRRAFGVRRTVIGTCYVAADRPAPGRVVHNGGKDILLARRPGNAAALAAAASLLRAAGWVVHVKSSEPRLLWTKLCFNAAINGLGSLAAAPSGKLAEDPALREILQRVIREAAGIARKAGRPPLYRHMEALAVRGCRNAPAQRNSTLQDLEAGRPTETEAIFGPLLSAARRTRTPAPMLSVLAGVLARLEKRR